MGRPRTFDDGVIAKRSLYNAFKSKHELFDRARDRDDRQVSELAAG